MTERCEWCDPSFGCFNGSQPCSKSPAALDMVDHLKMLTSPFNACVHRLNCLATARTLANQSATASPSAGLGCMDCGKPYSDFPLDTTIPDEQWRMIHDSNGGVLCASCMVLRLSRLPGAIAVRARLEIAGKPCDRCDGFGSVKTYANQACIPINGRVVGIDWCIHKIVAALNAGGVATVASCCGHGQMPGRIDLSDGRVLTIDSHGAKGSATSTRSDK